MPKRITLEELAVMIKKGFDVTATKEDLKSSEDRIGKQLDKLIIRVDRLEKRQPALKAYKKITG